MAQQKLQTIITIGGNVDNTFGTIGNALIGLGGQIDMISQKIIEFGKESIEKYVNYDDLMREVKALGEYSDAEIKAFDAYNKQIAQSSRHTMEAAASAEGLIAQLGLGIEETKALLPSVLDLSVAAKTDTATALDYLYYTLNAFDLELTDAEMLADQMSKTAAIGATEIDTLGGSFQRMGSSLRLFSGGSSEVLAILNGIGQFGDDMQGTKAGTQLRNFMLSLIAPTASKADLLATLNDAGVSAEEYEAYISEAGISSEEAAAAMEKIGFSAYDASGKIKPAIQIIDELNRALAGYSEQDQNEILGTLFGKRTYVTASNLLSFTKEQYEAWQREILYNSDGFTEDMADTMDGGLGGALRELEAAWSAMQITIGDHLAPAVENVAGFLKDISVAVTNTDPEILDAIVSGLGTIAVAGPALMTAGLAFRLIGYALTPAGGIGLGLIALVAAAQAIEKLQEADMAGNFGNMELDATTLGGYVEGLGTSFKAAYDEVNLYSAAMDTAVEKYNTASTTFSGDLLTKMLTASTLMDGDKLNLQNLGKEMYTQLTQGISNATAASMSYWEMLFGGDGTAEYDPDYQAIIDITNTSYQNLMQTAETVSRELGQAMDSAFKDGIITGDEYSIIMEKLDAYNKALAEATDKQNYVEFQSLLHKAQTASWDDVKQFAQDIQTERESTLAQEQDRFDKEYYGLEWDFNKSIAAAQTEAERLALQQQRDGALTAAREYHTQRVQAQSAQYDGVLMRLWESTMGQSDLAGIYNGIQGYADMVLAGEMSQQSAQEAINSQYGRTKWGGDKFSNDDRNQVGEYLARMIGSLGGYEGIKEKLDYYQGAGNQDMVNYLSRLFLMEGLATKGAYMNIPSGTPFGWWDDKVMSLEGAQGAAGIDIGQYIADYTLQTAKNAIASNNMEAAWQAVGQAIQEQNGSQVMFALQDLGNSGQREFNNVIAQLSQLYDFDKILAGNTSPLASVDSAFREMYAAYELLYGEASRNPDAFRIPVTVDPQIGANAVDEAAGEQVITAEIVPAGQGEAAQGAANEAQGVLDANGLNMDVDLPNGGNEAASFRGAAQSFLSANPGSWLINVSQVGGGMYTMPELKLYADGGRADEASIFGEAGPEWAIPEEHSARTADLLDSARRASGFTWPELLARTGGLNAGGGNTLHVVYSPVIHAADARGVEQKLREDKERFNNWFNERQLLEGVEVYQ